MLSTPKRHRCAISVTLCALLAACSAAKAQSATGVSDKEIVIGSCAALKGPSSFLGRETVARAEADFRVGATGGSCVWCRQTIAMIRRRPKHAGKS